MATAETGHNRNFEHEKAQCLSRVDLSRKGTIDHPIFDLVQYINSASEFFTTSSCSGRIILFEHVADLTSGSCKKGCRWLLVTHDLITSENLHSSLESIQNNAVFKFEPFVMHIQCVGLRQAQAMHQVAVMSGFRNSGITVSTKRKVMVAIRSTHSLEVPVSQRGKLLVSKEYLDFLIVLANEKMAENQHRIDRLFQNLKNMKVENNKCLTRNKRRKDPNVPHYKMSTSKHKTESSSVDAHDIIEGKSVMRTSKGDCDISSDADLGSVLTHSRSLDTNSDETKETTVDDICDDLLESVFAKTMFDVT